MLKSLASKAIIPTAVAVTGFVIVCCILLYSVINADMTRTAVRYSSNLADTVIKSTRYAMLRDDREMLASIVSSVDSQSGTEHVRIFNKKGLIMFSGNEKEVGHFVDKNTAGCIECHSGPEPVASLGAMEKARTFTNERQVEVLAITSPIYNDPACFNAACHVHPPEQKILGTLDIGLDKAPLTSSLAVMGERMVVFSLMVLLLTVGGVAALMTRHVFTPIRQLVGFTERPVGDKISRRKFDSCTELRRLADNFTRLGADLECARRELAVLHRAAEHKSRPADGQADYRSVPSELRPSYESIAEPFPPERPGLDPSLPPQGH